MTDQNAVAHGATDPNAVPRYVIGIDILRVFCAVYVMAFHLIFWFRFAEPMHRGFGGYSVDYESWARLFWPGWIGVEIFFVISGFVITASAMTARPTAFLKGRALRLLPGLWICATVTLGILALCDFGPYDAETVLWRWLKTVTLMPFEPWIDPAIWTLGVEVAFYALVFSLIAAGTTRHLFAVVKAIGVISAVFWIANLASDLAPDGLTMPIYLDVTGDYGIARVQELLLLKHGCFFALGLLLATWSRTRRFSPVDLILGLVFEVGAMLEIRAASDGVLSYAGASAHWTMPAAIWAVAVLAIPVSVLWNDRLVTGLGRTAPAIRLLGLATFPLYLVHQVVGYTLLQQFRAVHNDTAVLAITIVLIVGASLFISARVEPRVRMRMKAVFDRLGWWFGMMRLRSIVRRSC
jgi:peptidoglycan/LPS O-acetylase OafA/YrhL